MNTRQRMTVCLTGDSVIQRRISRSGHPLAERLVAIIRSSDVSFTNIEVVPNDFAGDPVLESGGTHFGAPSSILDELLCLGFNMFSLANNHALDYGVAGLRRALAELQRRDICFSGAGVHLDDARRPAYHTGANGTAALISCASSFARGQEAGCQRSDVAGRPGINPLHYETIFEVTPPQMDMLREISDQLGITSRMAEMVELGFRFPPREPDILPFHQMNFRAADKPGIRTFLPDVDVAAIARWVGEAREVSDLVIVSVHAHERGASDEAPPEFLPPFARRMIDEGAHIVVAHGPHLLRGLEVYKGCPIFYSLGNFVGQNELTPRLPYDSYETGRASQALTPGAFYRHRSRNDQIGFPADRRFWQTVAPVCTFENGRFVRLEVHPVSLGFGQKQHIRGQPRLAEGEEASEILSKFMSLSGQLGTDMVREEHFASANTEQLR